MPVCQFNLADMADHIDVATYKQKLLDWRAELEAASARSKDKRDAVELDQGVQGRLSRQDALMQQEMAKDNERRRQANIQRIDAALKRMDVGDYGFCMKCDEEIPARRLDYDPAVAMCVDCASGNES
jgi:DnaK suppressor protein